jgi:arylsulfatase B
MMGVLLAMLVPAAAAATAAAAPQQPPSVLFILADDLGFNEMGFNNASRGLLTPHLDRLAHGGVILRQYYVQPICSPTRSALMTGRYTIRLGTQSNVIWWDSPWGIPLNETFLPENLKDAGFITAMFGKWHLGMYKQEYTPARRGFDEHMGYYQGCESRYTHVAACCTEGSPSSDQNLTCAQLSVDGVNATQRGSQFALGYDWFKTGPSPNAGTSEPDLSVNHTSSALLLRDAAVDFIQRAAEQPRPFFLYLPFQNVHDPYTVDERYRDMYEPGRFTEDERTLFGYITEMDDAVGAVAEALNASGRYSNSITIFSSDNGAPGNPLGALHKEGTAPGYIARNYPFRGSKAHVWEGGTRVPGFVHSPLLPAAVRGTVSNALFHVRTYSDEPVRLACNAIVSEFGLLRLLLSNSVMLYIATRLRAHNR